MRLTSLALALTGISLATAAAAAAAANERTASLYIQPITPPSSSASASSTSASSPAPVLLAEIRYSVSDPSESEIINYEPLDSLPESTTLLRIGAYDPATARWTSSTSVTSPRNFGKGYAPHFVVTVDSSSTGSGDILGASVRGVKIDAGHTRDFGPQVVVVPTRQGKQPDLNKPVVLSPEGRKVQAEEEKSLLQKYWWVLAIVAVLVMTGGGEGK